MSCPPLGTGVNAVLEVARLTELMCILDVKGSKFLGRFCVLLFVMKSNWPG